MTSIANQIKSKNASRKNPAITKLTQEHETRSAVKPAPPYHPHGWRLARSPFPAIPLIEDGVDHINLWTKGKTDLGRCLAFDAPVNIDLVGFGEFASVFALWTYLSSEGHHDSIRFASTFTLRDWTTQQKSENNMQDFPNAVYICAVYIASAILDDSAITKSLIDTNRAPIYCYVDPRATGGGNPHPDRWTPVWWVDVIRCIRDCLVEGVDVFETLTYFKTTQQTDDEIFIAPKEPPKQARLGAVDRDAGFQVYGHADTSLKKAAREERQKYSQQSSRKAVTEGSYTGETHEGLLERLVFEDEYHIRTTTVRVFLQETAQARRELMAKIIKMTPDMLEEFEKQFIFEDTWKYPLFVHVSHSGEVAMVATSAFEPAVATPDRRTVSVRSTDDLLTVVKNAMNVYDPLTLEDFNLQALKKRKSKDSRKEEPSGESSDTVADNLPEVTVTE